MDDSTSGWLESRLTPAKKSEQRWSDFAIMLERFWKENFDTEYEKLENSKSIYTSSDDVLTRRLSELGDFYPVESIISSDDKILTLAWRNLALHYKDAKSFIELTILRKFGPQNIKWSELYHKKNDPYGTEFISKEKITSDSLDIEDYFLTSHGAIEADFSSIQATGIPLSEVVDQIGAEIEGVRPAHIVFEGIRIYDDETINIYMGSFMREAELSLIPPMFIPLHIENTLLKFGSAPSMITFEADVINPRACLVNENGVPDYLYATKDNKRLGYISDDDGTLLYDMPYIIMKGELYAV